MTAAWLFPVRVRQIVVWELAAVAVLAVSGFGEVPRIAVSSVAALAVLTTSVRIGGTHFAGWAAAWLGYRFRFRVPRPPRTSRSANTSTGRETGSASRGPVTGGAA